MKEKITKSKFLLYPTPVLIVGTKVNDRYNFINIAHVGIIDHNTISLSMGKRHHSNQGIKAHGVCSISFFSKEDIVAVDYVGIKSGAQVDKSHVFEIENEPVNGAPILKNAKISMVCKVTDVIDRGTHDLFLISPTEIYAEGSVLTEGEIDLTKVKPLLFDMASMHYFDIGEKLEGCWKIGNSY